jgi:hypothetical protein
MRDEFTDALRQLVQLLTNGLLYFFEVTWTAYGEDAIELHKEVIFMYP